MRVKKLNCPNCNACIDDDQNKCEYCGASLVIEEIEKNKQRELEQEKMKSVHAKNRELEARLDSLETRLRVADERAYYEEFTAPDNQIDIDAEALALSQEIAEANLASERRHRFISSIVSGICGVAGIVSGIFLLDVIVYVGIILLALGILCLCKIFYTYMRSRYTMTPAGFTYSAIISILITAFGIFGGISILNIPGAPFEVTIRCTIPFLLALVAFTYFAIKSIFFIRERLTLKKHKK